MAIFRRRYSRRAGGWRVLAAIALMSSAAISAAPGAGAAANVWPRAAVGGFSTPTAKGYWLLYANGDVSTSGDAGFYGSAVSVPLQGPIVGGSVLRSGTGYWLVSSDGGIFSYGSARFHGSMGATTLNQPVFSMAASKSGNGYWLVARDGGIFSFGDAKYLGSTGGIRLTQPITGITRTVSGNGYRLVAADGGIFDFGDAHYRGSLPALGVHVSDVVGMARTQGDTGYWIARSNGRVYAFGDALTFRRFAAQSCDPVTAIFADPRAQGYQLVTRSGATITFGAYGPHRTGPLLHCAA